jgi:dTDP-4-amino-4,6-dideoxygalactose transaminase
VEAILWAGLIPVFADCLPDTLNLDPQDVKRKIKNETSAILATHIYGNPVNIEGLEELARSSGIKLFIDAAHGFGARYKGQAVGGFGNAEVMSLSPTKLLIAAEGGVVTTNDGDLATHLRWARNYGDPGNYDCQILGLNARMSEFHASLALAGLKGLEQRVTRRNEIAGIYTETLGMLPGVRFQTVSDGDRSSRKDFALFIDESEFGLSRDVLALALEAENIGTRNYYHPPVHEQTFLKAYPHRAEGLEITSRISRQALCVPVYSLLTDGDIGNICQAIIGIHRYAQEIESVSTS